MNSKVGISYVIDFRGGVYDILQWFEPHCLQREIIAEKLNLLSYFCLVATGL